MSGTKAGGQLARDKNLAKNLRAIWVTTHAKLNRRNSKMNTTYYQWNGVGHEAKKLAKKMLNEQIKFTMSANNIEEKTPEWYLLEALRQRVADL